MFCPRCNAEYRAGFDQCSDCGIKLVYRLFPVEETPYEDSVAELVVVRTYLNELDADVARTVLEAAGIQSMFKRDDYGGVYPGLSFTRGIELVVRSDEAAEADKILSIDATKEG